MSQKTHQRKNLASNSATADRGEKLGSVDDNGGITNLTDEGSPAESTVWESLLHMDIALTNKLAVCASKESVYGHLRPLMRFLEYSCHGIPWLTFTLAAILMSHQIRMHQKLMNLFLGLCLDLLVSFILKTAVRRKRPPHNKDDMFGTVSVDRYSFPSGHATRAGMLACLLTVHFNLGYPTNLLYMLWMGAVSLSRIILGRHHVSDVVCGVLIGFIQYYVLVNFLWLSADTCEALILPIQEELHL